MFSALLLSTVILASPINCSPDVGQIRWDNVKQDLRGQNLTVHGSIWDQDRDGRPSRGDVMRIDSASLGTRHLVLDETWIVLGHLLAKEIAKTIKRQSGRGSACETGISVRGLPRMISGKALARSLVRRDKKSRPRARDVIEAEMNADADRACDDGKSLSERKLARLLHRKSRGRHDRASRRLLKRLATKVARRRADDCARLDLSESSATGLTF